MTEHADSKKLNVLMITSDVDSYINLQSSLGGNYSLQKVDEPDNMEDIGIQGARHDIVLILREILPSRYLEGLKTLIADAPAPILLFVEDDPYNLAPTAIRYGITTVVVDRFKPKRVPKLIEVSIERFQLYQTLKNELTKSQEELAARKVIERAKGLLMDKRQLSEQEAYRTLRELAMRQSKPIKEVAETLLIYSDILP